MMYHSIASIDLSANKVSNYPGIGRTAKYAYKSSCTPLLTP